MIGSMKSVGSMTDLPATAENQFSSSSPSPNRLPFFSSASSNESSDSSSSAAAVVAARKRLLNILNFRSFSSSTHGSSLSPMGSLQAVPPSARSWPAYPVYKTPVKVEVQEDVLVMDAISESMPGPGRGRHPLKIISSSSSINNYTGGAKSSKTEICQSWEEYGFCRFGSRCQFAHGKEELRGGGSRSWKLKPEIGKYCSTIGSSDKYLRYTSPGVMSSLLPNYEAAASTCVALRKNDINKMEMVAPTGHPLLLQQQEQGFSWPPTEAQEVEIQKVLYGPTQRRNRLPVFVKICSEPDPQF